MGQKLPNQSISGRIPSDSLQLNHKTKKLQPANMLEKTKNTRLKQSQTQKSQGESRNLEL